MSRDRRGDGIQEVVSSILIGSTNQFNDLDVGAVAVLIFVSDNDDCCTHSARTASAGEAPPRPGADAAMYRSCRRKRHFRFSGLGIPPAGLLEARIGLEIGI
jgi:hypothetical protein